METFNPQHPIMWVYIHHVYYLIIYCNIYIIYLSLFLYPAAFLSVDE